MKFSIKCLSLFLIVGSVAAYAADTASILPPAKTTFVDQNGKPLTSGTVDFYIPSTTTRKATWQDAGETILNANPVVLDAAGRAIILGSGSYRQVVKDRNNNVIWDQVTSSTGSGGGSAPTATGDGDLVGTIKPWAGLTAPNQYMFTYGQELSRTSNAALFTAITSSQSVFCNSGNPIISGLVDTTNFNIGVPVELSCVVGGATTITAKTGTTVTLASTPNVTANISARFFPWGNGNAVTTFNLPDYRGIVPIGNNNMGGIASGVTSSTYFGSDPNSIGALGGSQLTILNTVNLPAYTPQGSIVNGAITSTFTGLSGQTGLSSAGGSQAYTSGGFASSQIVGTVASTQAASTFIGTSQGGLSTAFSRIQPSKTINFIIKVTPDVNSATASGVTSLGLMTGSIACGTNLLCTGNVISLAITDPISGPGASSIGNFTFWTDTLGRSIGATPAFISANPANASIYSQIAMPASGAATYNGIQFSMGTPILGSDQFGAGAIALRQAIVGTADIPASDTIIGQASGIAGYAKTNRPAGGPGANPVGVYAQGVLGVSGGSVFASNAVARNTPSGSSVTGFDANQITGTEVDVELWKKSDGSNPVVPGAYGIQIAGGGNIDATPSNSAGIFLNNLSVTTGTAWDFGIQSYIGSARHAFVAGALHSGTNQNSQPIAFQFTDGSGISTLVDSLYVDSAGSLYVNSKSFSLVNIGDNITTYLSTGSGVGASGVKIPAMTVAGVVHNSASGALSSSKVANADLISASTTVNGTTCTLGASCTVSSAAASLVIGTTTVSGAAGTTQVLFDNSGVLGEHAVSGTGNVALTSNPVFTTPDLGTPSAVVLTNATGTASSLSVGTAASAPIFGLTGAGTGVLTFLNTPTSANLKAAVTDETGSGALVFGTSASLITPNLGTPSAITLTSGTGLPISTGVTGLGSGVAAALAIATSTSGGPLVNGGTLGTPANGIATNLTGTASGLTAGNVTTNANLTGPVTSVGNATTIGTNQVSRANLAQGSALSIIGNTTNSTANVADIAATSDGQVMRRSGTAIGFGSVDLANSNAVGSTILPTANGGTGIATAPPNFRAYLSANQTITTATPTKILFDVVDWDIGSYWSAANHNYKPLVAGTYQVSFAFIPNGTFITQPDTILGIVSKNGLFGGGGVTQILTVAPSVAATSSDQQGVVASTIVQMNGSTDTIEIDASITISSGSPVVAGSANRVTQVAIYRIGP